MLPAKSANVGLETQKLALNAIAAVVTRHLNDEARRQGMGKDPILRDERAAPVLVQVDGAGKSQFLDSLAQTLAEQPDDHRWATVRFDAWQHQRVAPPWWWLVKAIDRGLAEWYAPAALARYKRIRNVAGRWARLLVWLLISALATVVTIALMQHMKAGVDDAMTVVKSLATLVSGLTALAAFVLAIMGWLKRHLLAESPAGATALLRSTDPMADLRRRYGFLLRGAGANVAVLIDNLDRCHAEYVVNMLEGIQTLLRIPPKPRRWWQSKSSFPPLVVYVVAADQAWLCDSYLHAYEEFASTRHDAGRPFGLSFLDKIFPVALRLPTIPIVAPAAAPGTAAQTPPLDSCNSEGDVRRTLQELEHADGELSSARPNLELRAEALKRLAEIELRYDDRQCSDTRNALSGLMLHLDPPPVVGRRIDVAYCVQRTAQLLGGNEIDADPPARNNAIRRLGLWTILWIQWPLLAAHLTAHPDDIECLRRASPPAGVTDSVEAAFKDPAAVRVGAGDGDVVLSAEDITRFTIPMTHTAGRPSGASNGVAPPAGREHDAAVAG